MLRWAAVRHRLTGAAAGPADRGDVPGWVMITVMTAALVVAILVPFRSAIVAAVTKAMADVTGT
ncbi:MAG: hypothetical protein M3O55_03710 [Actinomycetota bacterium]|nr:hypothetical protein [Actinomycetota bacterium]